MPFYKITVVLKDLTAHSGIRQNISPDINVAYRAFRASAERTYGRTNIEYYTCEGLSDEDERVRPLLKKKGRNKETQYEPEAEAPKSLAPKTESRKDMYARLKEEKERKEGR